MMDTPSQENTAILRMKKDFNQFLAGNSSSNREGKRLTFDDSCFDNSVLDAGASFTRRPVSTRTPPSAQKHLVEKEKVEKQRQVELITARSRISQLESQLNSLDTSRKRARIEFDRDLENKDQEYKSEIEKISDLKEQIRVLEERGAETLEELKSLQQKQGSSKTNLEGRVMGLQKEKFKLDATLHENEENYQAQLAEVRGESLRLNNSIQNSRLKVQELEEQHEADQIRCAGYVAQVQELEEFRNKCVESDIRIKELEMELEKISCDVTVTKAMKSQLDRLQELEKENRKLKEENVYNSETRENVILHREANESLRKKLERAEERSAQFVKLQVEHRELQKKLGRWETADDQGVVRPRSPSELTKRVSDFQQSNASLLERQGTLQSSVHVLEESGKSKEQQLKVSTEQLIREQQKTEQQNAFIKRLQRKLLLISKERDCYKGVLDSYESEATVNLAPAASTRINQLEETVAGYRKHITSLETELGQVTEQLSSAKSQALLAEQRLGVIQSQGSSQLPHVTSESDQKIIRGLRAQIEDLEKNLETVHREKDILAERIERRNLQGDYDPSKIKVLSFAGNPFAMAQKRQSEESSTLRAENEKMKERLRVLEETGGQVEDLTVKVEARLQQPSTSKEVEDIRGQVVTAELKNKRLMEAFKKTSTEFREVCYQLLGYRIDMKSDNQYRLMNMYAESPEEYLLFKQSSDGAMQMLGTEYSSTLDEKIEHYLQGIDSIPAFLSSITLDLLSRQTMLQESS